MKSLINRAPAPKHLRFLAGIVIILLMGLAACSPAQTQETSTTEHEHTGDHEETEESDPRLPNNGAVVKIISPSDGATIKSGEDILVEIEVENFDLNTEGNHWHLYVDASVVSMLSGGTTKTAIHGLEPGEHHVEVYLGLPTHEELEDGASVMIMVTE